MGKIILLSGEVDCGKTTSLNLLYSLIKDSKEHFSSTSVTDAGKGDYVYEFEYRRRKVVICTHRDVQWTVETNINTFAPNCDVLISACNWSHAGRRTCKPFEEALSHDKLTTIVLKREELDELKW